MERKAPEAYVVSARVLGAVAPTDREKLVGVWLRRFADAQTRLHGGQRVTVRSRVVVAVTGASGSVYGLRLLERLAERADVETHFVMSRAGMRTAHLELGVRADAFSSLATETYPVDDVGAAIASGSFPIDAMVIAPCSVNTMSAIACGLTENLVSRAADVTLKERRRLVLVVRESPLHVGHLRTMTALTEIGAIIAPPLPAFYAKPHSLGEMVDHSVDRVLDLINLPRLNAKRWGLPTLPSPSLVS